MTIILASAGPGEVRVMAIDTDGPLDVALWRPAMPDGVGDLHRGRVVARMPALAGSFVAIAGGDGFLPDSEGGGSEGTVLGVRITRAAQGGKGPRLSARFSDAERALVGSGPPALLRRGPNAVERLAALHPDASVCVDDAALLPDLLRSLDGRATLVACAFDDAAETAWDALGEPSAELPGGARMSVHPTPALTAIDVDLAGASAARGSKSATHAAGNRALLPALARQIRLRNLGGAIVVDLAGLSPRRRAALAADFVAALAGDPLAPRFLGFSALGLAEILRPRVHAPLHEMLAGPHAAGLAGLRRLARRVAVRPDLPPTLHAAPALCAALERDAFALADLARRAGRPLMLAPDPALVPLGWRVEE